MSDKYLPIKIFEKRKDYDDRSTEGGGDSREPGFVFHGEALRNHARVLSGNVYDVRSQMRMKMKKPRTLPLIMATSINDSAIAKSHRGRVVNILDSDGNDNVIGVYGDRQLLSVLASEAVLDNLEAVFQDEDEAILTSSLTGMEMFYPVMDEYEVGHIEYRVRLIDYNDFDRNFLARGLFEKYCKENGIQIQKKSRFTADMYIYRVAVDSATEYSLLGEFEGLYSVELTSPLDVLVDSLSENEDVPVKKKILHAS